MMPGSAMTLSLPVTPLSYAAMCPLGEQALLISTRDGCYELNLRSEGWRQVALPGPPLYPTFGSPTASEPPNARCAVATRACWVPLWSPGDGTPTILELADAAWSVAMHPNGSMLAVGTGNFPLGAGDSHAAIELWSTTPPRCLTRRVLAGCCANHVAFSPDGCTLLVYAGVINQAIGMVFLLDSDTLGILDVADTRDPFMRCAALTEDSVVLVGEDGVTLRSLNTLQSVRWHWAADRPIVAASLQPGGERLLLSSGHLLDLLMEEVRKLPEFEDSIAVAITPQGACYGLTDMGILHCAVIP